MKKIGTLLITISIFIGFIIGIFALIKCSLITALWIFIATVVLVYIRFVILGIILSVLSGNLLGLIGFILILIG